RQTADGQIAVVTGEVRLDVAPPVGEGDPVAAEVNDVQTVGPAVARAEAHPGEHADPRRRIDALAVVSLAPDGLHTYRVHPFVDWVHAAHSVSPVVRGRAAPGSLPRRTGARCDSPSPRPRRARSPRRSAARTAPRRARPAAPR